MNKKNMQRILILLLLAFSFFYTNKTIELIRNVDPIMKEIKKQAPSYQISPIEAVVLSDSIIPGIVGKQVDIKESYSKMKKYGKYTETLTTFKDLSPTISLNDCYDKYIINGNKSKKAVALIFILDNNSTSLLETINILEEKNIKVTFFIDQHYLENNLSEIKRIKENELEVLNSSNYDETYYTSILKYLSSITDKSPKYCYTEKKDENLLKLCSKLNLHTIIPSIKIEENPYKKLKNNLENAQIISLKINKSLFNELPILIDYISQKGYKIETLEALLSEKN